MKHHIYNKRALPTSYFLLNIQLIPENQTEQTAIKNIENFTADDAEREFVENYLLFNIPPYSGLTIEQQAGNNFIVKATRV